ncbi:hypothetical protein CP533_2266 [Ophiocordyceps camponoti-saundersi (nom. inval.)]|nr:hypothetical protein CP533_2266 [Ophiocordyceps camponoti-saundersi (nom. inval.)]
MPFVGEGRNINGIFHPDRKRRRDGAASEADARLYRLYSSERLGQDPSSRRMTKRVRGDDDEENDEMTDVRRRRPSLPQNKPDQYHHQQIPRFSTTTTAAAAAAAAAAALLLPCHVCHRRPTKKSDLDSFAKCQGCQRRTCFVCIRECHGWLPELPPPQSSTSETFPFPMDDDGEDEDEDDEINPPNHNHAQHYQHQHYQPSPPLLHADDEDEDEDDDVAEDDGGWNTWGHRAVVCSRCCVERGRQGDVVCLGCLAGLAGA